MALPTLNLHINYDDQQQEITRFLRQYKVTRRPAGPADDTAESVEVHKYMDMLQDVADRTRDTVVLELDDLQDYLGTDSLLVENVCANTKHYVELISRSVDAVIPPPCTSVSFRDEVVDIILQQRQLRNEANQQLDPDGSTSESFPPSLTRRYTLYIHPLSVYSKKSPGGLSVRQVRGAHLGHLITIRAIVTRVSDVKPSLQVTAYTCDNCGMETFEEVTSRQFIPLNECPSRICRTNNTKGQLFMSTRASKFLPFQDVKVQELTEQVSVGHIPRSLTVHVYGPLTRSLNPGDVADISGIFLPIPYTGFKAIRAGLLTDTYLEAQRVVQMKKQYNSLDCTPEILQRLEDLKLDGNIYDRLAKSIAPEIFGHEDVKKALLLLLIGGVTKNIGDGMRIRGDINVCLMGDPGVAKSQLLKYISKVAPRGVYTTGRGSSGVGLTAAVMRDPITDEMVLEGGALVLADNGICCIDEFDKMDESDRTAIHEVMEQQTISIAKAGITTTLNARAAILAAANPLYGRYNPKVSPIENINLPAALLSRFDLLFLILDIPARDIDEQLAQHVTFVHIHKRHPEMNFEALEPEMIRNYIAQARLRRPTVPKDVANYIVGSYVQLRQRQKRDEGQKRHFSQLTPRTLLAIIRIAQALARLRFDDYVVPNDVDEALRLIAVSKYSLDDTGHLDEDMTISSKIYKIVRDLAVGDGEFFTGHWQLQKLRERVLAKGFTEDQFMDCIREYDALGVWNLTIDKTAIDFISGGDDDMMALDA